MSRTGYKVDRNRKPTLSDIEYDLNNNEWSALYFATGEQIVKLIDQGRIDEDFYSRWDNYQEEIRCLFANTGV